jgi:class 3 adenylate cyclase/energy-coupling factor transporter ATP-binding protein EcfA2
MLRRLAPVLPAELFGRLRAFPAPEALPEESGRAFADSLQQAISHLDSFHHTLTTYLPRYLLDLAPTPGEPNGELYRGSFIFADVTGFTALTGELSKRGTEGREEMNRLMRSLFAALLDPLLASGGDLLFFAGDAALACFPAQPEGQDAEWVTRTALRLVRAIIPFKSFETPYGTFSLTMSAGVERGTAYAAVVGTKKRMELLISGGPVQGATDAEGEGEPGQVIAGPGILPLLDPGEFKLSGNLVEGVHGDLDDYESVPPTRRRSRLSALFSRRIPDLLEHAEQALSQVERLTPFIPHDLLTQIARGEDIRQHPPVSIQFVNLSGFEELALDEGQPELATAALQKYFVQAQEIVNDREGIISQVDPYAKGFTLLNPFGAPTHHEGVPRLAASTALELERLLGRVNDEFELDPPLTQRVGMTYDRIFTGEIGYRHRREYVVAGPAVNLAARLMSKADFGQIVLDPAAWEAVQQDFSAQELPPIPLKGIPEPVPRFALQAVRKGKGLNLTDYPLAGHQKELTKLTKLLDKAASGKGKAIALVGQAGIGKSRLAVALAEAAREREMAVLTGRCRPFGQTMPYLPWADAIGSWFEIDDETPAEERRQQLRDRLEQFDLVTSFPAFADLIGLPPLRSMRQPRQKEAEARPQGPSLFATVQKQAPQTKTDTASLATLLTQRVAEAKSAGSEQPSIWQALRERAHIPQALHMLLERQVAQQPTLLILEDFHWMDRDSCQVLQALLEATPGWPLLLLVTARPESDWTGKQIELGPISEADSSALAAVALQANSLEPELATWIFERAGGNPLFTLSYCRALRDARAVVVDSACDQARWSGPPPALPISLQELLLAQVDRLDPQARETTQRGAVIGSTFSTQLLTEITQERFAPQQLDQTLDMIARRDLIAPPPPGRSHTFSSHSLHDAVYAALSHAQRQSWHKQIGDHLAETDEETRYECLEQIAYHYARSGVPFKAAHFTRLAGDKARSRQADAVALKFYSQTLDVQGKGRNVAAEKRLAHEGIGDVHSLHDELDDALRSYKAALEGAYKKDQPRLRSKIALLGPLIRKRVRKPLESSQAELPKTDPLRAWVGAAVVWLYAAKDVSHALELCKPLLDTATDSAQVILQQFSDSLEKEEPLPPYEELFSLYTSSRLRLPPGG